MRLIYIQVSVPIGGLFNLTQGKGEINMNKIVSVTVPTRGLFNLTRLYKATVDKENLTVSSVPTRGLFNLTIKP